MEVERSRPAVTHRLSSLDVVCRRQDHPFHSPRSLGGLEHVLRGDDVPAKHLLERGVGRAYSGQVNDVRESLEAWTSDREIAWDVDEVVPYLGGAVATRTTLRHAFGEPEADDLPAVRSQRYVQSLAEDSAATRDGDFAFRLLDCRHCAS